MTQIKKLQI